MTSRRAQAPTNWSTLGRSHGPVGGVERAVRPPGWWSPLRRWHGPSIRSPTGARRGSSVAAGGATSIFAGSWELRTLRASARPGRPCSTTRPPRSGFGLDAAAVISTRHRPRARPRRRPRRHDLARRIACSLSPEPRRRCAPPLPGAPFLDEDRPRADPPPPPRRSASPAAPPCRRSSCG